MRIILLTIIALSIISSSIYSQELSYSENTPQWLRQGCELYFGDHFSPESVEDFINNVQALPTLQDLESLDTDPIESNTSMTSYLLVKFIDTQWNRAKLLELIDDYENFETVLGFLKKDVEKHWFYHTLFRTHAFKSGDTRIALFIDDLLETLKKATSITHKKNKSAFEQSDIEIVFDNYKAKMLESDNHLLIIIETNAAVAGWALFSLQSDSRVLLEALCVNPDYRTQDIHQKLVAAVNQKFRTIKTITTANQKMNVKLPYFCGSLDKTLY